MIWEKTKERLAAGEPVVGRFGPLGEQEGAAGFLRWRLDDGAVIDLLEAIEWPGELGGDHFPVHCILEGGDEITIPDAWIKTVSIPRRVTRVVGSTLLLGALVDNAACWPRAVYRTANLGAWRKTSGLKGSYPNRRKRPHHFRIDWQPPPIDEVSVRGARLRFVTESKFWPGDGPDAKIETKQRVVVDVRRPLRMEQLIRDYAMPLRALVTFATDRPDDMVEEVYFDPESRDRIEVWRAGSQPTGAEWRDQLLFESSDLADFAKSIRRWWRLYEKVRPSLGIYADHVNEGRSFSPARLLTMHTAISAYSDLRHGHHDLRKLRRYSGVANEVTGASNEALALFGASRNYFSHLGSPGEKFSVEEIEANTVASTRRASALMQACLLKELGFTKTQIASRLVEYYGNWPL